MIETYFVIFQNAVFSFSDVAALVQSSFLTYTPYLMLEQCNFIYPNNHYSGLAVAAVVRKRLKAPILFTERARAVSSGSVSGCNLKFKLD